MCDFLLICTERAAQALRNCLCTTMMGSCNRQVELQGVLVYLTLEYQQVQMTCVMCTAAAGMRRGKVAVVKTMRTTNHICQTANLCKEHYKHKLLCPGGMHAETCSKNVNADPTEPSKPEKAAADTSWVPAV